MKRALIIVLILGTVIGLTWVGYQYSMPGEETVELTDDPTIELVQVERQTLVETVNATGQLEPQSEVEMKFEVGGMVAEVLVKRGQFVTAGTVLARLETDNIELEIEKADIDLAKQEAALEQLLEPKLPERIEAARASVTSAQAKLADLLDGPDPNEVTKAESALAQKQIELKKAQWAYDQVAFRGDVGAMAEADALQDATLAYESAVADYNLAVKEATKAEIAEARSTLAGARAELADQLQGPSSAEIASQQADIAKAQLALQEARNKLTEAVLVAPTSGVLLSIDIEPGERVLNEADQAAVVIADISAYLLKVQVDEIDIAQLKPGQPTGITLDAFSEESFEGEVVDIAPNPAENDSNGIVTYEVTISLDVADHTTNLLPGMTATAAVETKRLAEALVVPNRAIQIDRSQNPPVVYVEKLSQNDDVQRVEVELGLRDGEHTEVIAGLEEGDQVVIRQEPPTGPSPSI